MPVTGRKPPGGGVACATGGEPGHEDFGGGNVVRSWLRLDLSLEQRVEALLVEMTLAEKVGQTHQTANLDASLNHDLLRSGGQRQRKYGQPRQRSPRPKQADNHECLLQRLLVNVFKSSTIPSTAVNCPFVRVTVSALRSRNQ